MKILSVSSIEQVSGKDLGFYLGENSHHKATNALNDIPSVQWVAGYPDDPADALSFNIDSGRFELKTYFYLNMFSSMNCIYFGKFKTDRLEWSAKFNHDGISAIDLDSPSDNHETVIEVPIRIYETLRDFVIGDSTFYTDYFKTLDEIVYPTPYIIDSPEIKINLFSEFDILKHTPNREIGWKISSQSSFLYTNEGDENPTTYYLTYGNLVDIRTGNIISIKNTEFTEDLSVGSFFLLKQTNNISDAAYYDPALFQMVSIRGEGEQLNDIIMISTTSYFDLNDQISINSFNNAGNPVDEADQLNPSLASTYEVQQVLTDSRIGLVRCGNFEEFPNPQVGLSKQYKDYSVRTELINGGHQFINRNAAKEFSGSLILEREQVNRLKKFALSQRAKPFPVDIITGMDLESPTSMFCVFSSLPTENYSYRTGEVRDVSFSVKQIF
jgi:hypothetical protein